MISVEGFVEIVASKEHYSTLAFCPCILLLSVAKCARLKDEYLALLKQHEEYNFEKRCFVPKLPYTHFSRCKEALVELYGDQRHPLESLTPDEIASCLQAVDEQYYAKLLVHVDRAIEALTSIGALIPNSESDRAVQDHFFYLSYEVFSPWYRASSYTAADYFIRIGGVAKSVSLLRHVSEREPQVAAKYHGVIGVLSVCWNLTSSADRARLMIDAGALPILLKLLRETLVHDVSDHCIGMLWGLVEFHDVQVSR